MVALSLAVLAALALLLAPPAAAREGPALSVDAAAERHPISPDIYGINFADQELATAIDLPVDRWGGNLFEKYNWQLGAVNLARDWFYENAADCFIFRSSCAGGNDPPFHRTFIERARLRGTKPLITLPMLGHVVKDAPTEHPLTCSFPKTTYTQQDAVDPWDPNCGNGRDQGVQLPGDPSIAGMPAGPAFAGSWVTDLRARYGPGAVLYELGNEPGLWHETHADMHPARVTYDELRDKTIALGKAVKDADPAAKTLGFSEWGWPNYFCSAADNVNLGCFASSPDRADHGGEPLVSWLLEELRRASEADGRRLVDYLDLHYYLQQPLPARPTDVTRALYDPAYTDPSWIGDVVRLLPRMREWVDAEWPGTKLALSEYDLSLPSSVPDHERLDVLIQADALGIFGREGLDLAAYFDERAGKHLRQGVALAPAFKLYRSYDGGDGRFGDVSVKATSTDQPELSVFAAQRSSDGALTVAAVNKAADELDSPLTVDGFRAAAGAAQVWRWTGSGDIVRAADATVDGRAQSFPARSLTMFVLAPAATPDPQPTATATPPAPTATATAVPPPAATATVGPAPTLTASPTPPVRCTRVPTGLTRKTVRTARRRLKALGCAEPRTRRARGRKGRVLRTIPRAGRPLTTGQRLILVVGR